MKPSSEYIALKKLERKQDDGPHPRAGDMFKCRMGVMLTLGAKKGGRGKRGHKWCYLTFVEYCSTRRFAPSLRITGHHDLVDNNSGTVIEDWLERERNDMHYIGNLFDFMPSEVFCE